MLTRIILYDPQLTIIPVSLILGLHSILHVKQIIIAPLSLSWLCTNCVLGPATGT